ncbi:hypothetical protein SAMN05216294_1989 [Flagellimonas zhangzhouensis]|nr:hypothetical protein SAMN05216294_1989 [Allomuricauda zhangzhouensis]
MHLGQTMFLMYNTSFDLLDPTSISCSEFPQGLQKNDDHCQYNDQYQGQYAKDFHSFFLSFLGRIPFLFRQIPFFLSSLPPKFAHFSQNGSTGTIVNYLLLTGVLCQISMSMCLNYRLFHNFLIVGELTYHNKNPLKTVINPIREKIRKTMVLKSSRPS